MESLVASWADYASVPFAQDGVITFKYADDLGNGLRDDILWSMERISDVLPFEFQEVSSDSEAEWNLKWLPRDSGWAGYASGSSYSGWNISFNQVIDYSDEFDRHLVLHEFGHALGLEHPFDDRDGDVWEGADVRDTVMAYQPSPDGYLIDYSRADWDTLTGLYGGVIPESIEPVEEVVVPVVPEPEPEPVEPEPEKEVEMGPFGIRKKKWDRIVNRFERLMNKGNTEKVVRQLDRKFDAFENHDLNQRLRRKTFTLQEENVIMTHVRNENWEAISQTRFFTRHNPTATNCPCCTK